MVKISFGVSKSNQNKEGTTKLSNKLSNVFSKPEIPQEKQLKKQIITELSSKVSNINYEDDDELSKYVIPCKNSLKDLKTEVKEVKNQVGDLKYGLNVLFKKENDETKVSFDEIEDVESYNTRNKNNPVDSSVNEDSEIAKLIIEESDRKRLHEELFGSDDLVIKSQKTTPILLRSRLKTEDTTNNNPEKGSIGDELSNIDKSVGTECESSSNSHFGNKGVKRGSSFEEEVDIKKLLEVKMDQYENVPVEKFGLAMLMGMGFDPKKNKNEPIVYKRRVFERAGLGADSVMKSNMECIMDTKLMAKLKNNHTYNIVDGTAITINWALPGILVKVSDKNHENYKEKGVVKSVKNNMVKLVLQGEEGKEEKEINVKYLETVVSKEGKLHKVVRRIPISSKKKYIEIGSLVKLIEKKERQAKILYENEELLVSLDSISQVLE